MNYLNKIYCGDGIEFMKNFQDNSIDLVLTDPPYNAKNIGPDKRKYDTGKMQLSQEEYKKFCENWFNEAIRISKRLVFTPGIANTHNYPQPDWNIAWYKVSNVAYNRMGGINAWEPIFIYGKPPRGNRLNIDFIQEQTLNWSKGPEKNHPCPKPPKLYSRLIMIFSKPGELILDPMIGSGTTAKVCQELGRNFIGVDLSEKYCEISRQRLAQIPLFIYQE